MLSFALRNQIHSTSSQKGNSLITFMKAAGALLTKEGARSMMIREPHFDTYSIPARICFAIAVGGGALLLAVAVTSVYFMQ